VEETRALVPGYLKLRPGRGADPRPYLDVLGTIKVKTYQLKTNPFWEECRDVNNENDVWKTILQWLFSWESKFDVEECKKKALEQKAYKAGTNLVSKQFMIQFTNKDYKKRLYGAALRYELLGHYDFEEMCEMDMVKDKLGGYLSPAITRRTSPQSMTEAVIILLVIKSMKMSLPEEYMEKESVFNMYLKQGIWDGMIKTRKESRALILKHMEHSKYTVTTLRIAGAKISSFLNVEKDLKITREAFKDSMDVLSSMQISMERYRIVEDLTFETIKKRCNMEIELIKDKIKGWEYNKAFEAMVRRAALHPNSKALGYRAIAKEFKFKLDEERWESYVTNRIISCCRNEQEGYQRLQELLPSVLYDYACNRYPGTVEEVIHCLRLKISLKQVGATSKYGELENLVIMAAYQTDESWDQMSYIGMEKFKKLNPSCVNIKYISKY
jgi:hypothetical protein